MSADREFIDAYLDCALWSSSDEDEQPLDDGRFEWRDCYPDTLWQMVAECLDFLDGNREELREVGTWSHHGHDFWLTRNGHGAGFWDRGYGYQGEILTRSAQAYGEADLFASDFKQEVSR